MYGPVARELVLEHPNASADIQVRETRSAPFPQRGQDGVQQAAGGAPHAALGIRPQILACAPGVKHAVEVLTMTTGHGCSLPLHTGVCRRASSSGVSERVVRSNAQAVSVAGVALETRGD